jgi:hypothetical protein
MMKSLKYLLLASLLLTKASFAAQQEGEPVNAPSDVPLGGFPGCFVHPPQDGCDARIVCNGVGTIFGTTGMDLQAATEEAAMEARNELAKFYSSKQKAQQALAKVKEDTAKSTADGGKAINSSMSRIMTSVSSTSAESILSGVQVLGRLVDTKQQAVTVKVGVSCRSQAAAASSQAAARQSANPGNSTTQGNGQQSNNKSGKNGAESYKIGPGNIQNMNQEVPNADKF